MEAREEYSACISRVLDGHTAQYRHICREVERIFELPNTGPDLGDVCLDL
jgi:hypothetical protein